MKLLKILLNILAFLIIYLPVVNAQQAVVSNGGNAEGDGGSVSYSIGQIAYQSLENNDVTIHQGVQQAFEIFIITSFEEMDLVKDWKLYPNPNAGELYLSHSDLSTTDEMKYKIFDSQGRVIEIGRLTANPFHIDMIPYRPGQYTIQVIINNQMIRTFKVIKN